VKCDDCVVEKCKAKDFLKRHNEQEIVINLRRKKNDLNYMDIWVIRSWEINSRTNANR